MKLWICWSTDPQHKEKLSCCSWRFSHSCATCQSVSELLLRSQAAEQSFHCRLGVCVSGLAIYHKHQRAALTWQMRSFTELFCQSLEGTNFCSRLLLPQGKGVWQRALAPPACSNAASVIASRREKHPTNPGTYCAQWSPPLRHLRFVPRAVCVCHMSQESREKAMYTKRIKNYKKKKKKFQAQFPCFQPRKSLHIF